MSRHISIFGVNSILIIRNISMWQRLQMTAGRRKPMRTKQHTYHHPSNQPFVRSLSIDSIHSFNGTSGIYYQIGAFRCRRHRYQPTRVKITTTITNNNQNIRRQPELFNSMLEFRQNHRKPVKILWNVFAMEEKSKYYKFLNMSWYTWKNCANENLLFGNSTPQNMSGHWIV